MKDILKNSIVTIVIHITILFMFYCILSFLGLIKNFPTNETLLQWDVGWYKSIVENGYSFNLGKQSNVAFFPLFPLVWKTTLLSPLWISVVNLIILLTGMLILQRTFNLVRRDLLLLLSIPSLFFCYVPYSEAIFFFAGSLIIYGLKKENWIAVIGIFIACMTRSSSLMFIPIILFAKLYNFTPNKSNRKLIGETILLILSAIVSTLLAQYIQFLESGEFFTLFKTQKEWNRILALPKLYLTTWDGARLIWLDGLAFLVGIISMSLCIVFLIKKYFNKQKTISSNILFSLGYLSLVTIVVLLYSGEDGKGGTTLLSLNRYVFSTPFFTVFLIKLLQRDRLNKKVILHFIIVSLIVWSLFNMLGNLDNLLEFFKTKIYFGIIFLYSMVYLIITNSNYKNQFWSGLYVLNVLLQIYLFNAFLNGVWIG